MTPNTDTKPHVVAAKHGGIQLVILLGILVLNVATLYVTDSQVASICALFGVGLGAQKYVIDFFHKLLVFYRSKKIEIASNIISTAAPDVFQNDLLTQFGITDTQTFFAKIDDLSSYLKSVKQPEPEVVDEAPAEITNPVQELQAQFIYPTETTI